jgi:hypothetical protein
MQSGNYRMRHAQRKLRNADLPLPLALVGASGESMSVTRQRTAAALTVRLVGRKVKLSCPHRLCQHVLDRGPGDLAFEAPVSPNVRVSSPSCYRLPPPEPLTASRR